MTKIHMAAASIAQHRIKKKGLPPSLKHARPGAFPCPHCGGGMIVTDSRPTVDGIKRVRTCTSCYVRATTFELEGFGSVSDHATLRTIINDLRSLADKYQLTLDRLDGKCDPTS